MNSASKYFHVSLQDLQRASYKISNNFHHNKRGNLFLRSIAMIFRNFTYSTSVKNTLKNKLKNKKIIVIVQSEKEEHKNYVLNIIPF